MKFAWKCGLVTFLLLSFCPLPGYSAVARSETYSMDYAIAGAGGGLAASATFEVVGLVQTQGALCASAGSTTYEVDPLLAESGGTSDVTDWMLY